MTHSFGRVLVSGILVPYIALAATIAPEHMHEPDADHPHSAVHRHLQPHSVAGHDADHAQFAGDDEHVVWLADAALHQAVYQFAAPAGPPTAQFRVVPPLREWASPPDYDSAPPHGPPRECLSLRAPPSLTA